MYDVIVIGGGITGAGVLRDVALRGLRAVLIEKGEPGRATTLSSTHLIHGGLRYLLYDRLTTHATCWDAGHIVRIARPLLTRVPILWPVYAGQRHGIETVETLLESYDRFQEMKYGRRHLRLSAEETLRWFPCLSPAGLVGAVSFDEWWVDPVALVQANLESALRAGAEVRTHTQAIGYLGDGKSVTGLRVRTPDGREEEIQARRVVNAGGPWAAQIAAMSNIDVPLRLRQGSHLLYNSAPDRLPPAGLILEDMARDRYIFVLPGADGSWLVGPTDVEATAGPDQLQTTEAEIRYLLASARRYLPALSERYDKLSVGARPILGQKTSEKLLSREFEVYDHGPRDGRTGLVTVAGGKMSDFRLMGEVAGRLVAEGLGKPGPTRTHLETLNGSPVTDMRHFSAPGPALKRFLRRHPRLREAHAWSYLAGGFLRHCLGRLGGAGTVTADQAGSYYNEDGKNP